MKHRYTGAEFCCIFLC